MSLQGQRFTPLEMLARLVAFDTESHKTQPAPDRFRGRAISQAGMSLSSDCRTRLATRPRFTQRSARQDRGGVVLSGHTDVVPVTGQSWTADPFVLRVEDGRAYGRGAVDMKAFDAIALALVPEFLAAGLKTRSTSCSHMTRRRPALASWTRSASWR